MYLARECPEHGWYEALHPWCDPRDYRFAEGLFGGEVPGGQADGLVLNLTSRCNQSCRYCFARADEVPLEEPSVEKIEGLLDGFAGSTVYLSGGEAALYPGLSVVIRTIKRRGLSAVLFSNGKKLGEEGFCARLKESGLDLVILQFDSLDDAHHTELRGEPLSAVKDTALRSLREAGIPVYLFVMLVPGLNDGMPGKIVSLASENSGFVKIVNFNPVWELGRLGPHAPGTTADVLDAVERTTGLTRNDFYEGTAFSYYLFAIIGRLSGRRTDRHPWCEMRCYLLGTDDGAVPLGRIVDLAQVNRRLVRAYRRVLSGALPPFIGLLLSFPGFFLLKEFLFNAPFRRLCLDMVRSFLLTRRGRPAPLAGHRLFSVIAGTFHTARNADLRMMETCNLFSDTRDGKLTSSCMRQISLLNDFEAQERGGV